MAVVGEIRIDTAVDNGGAIGDLKDLEPILSKLADRITGSIAKAFEGAAAAAEDFTDSMEPAYQSTEQLYEEMDKLIDKMEERQKEGRLSAASNVTLAESEDELVGRYAKVAETTEQLTQRYVQQGEAAQKTAVQLLEAGQATEQVTEAAAVGYGELVTKARQLSGVVGDTFGDKYQSQLSNAIVKLQQKSLEYDKQATKVSELKAQMDALDGSGSAEYLALSQSLADIERRISDIINLQAHLGEVGQAEEAARLDVTLNGLENTAEQLRMKMQAVASTAPNTEEYHELEDALFIAAQKAEMLSEQAANAERQLATLVDKGGRMGNGGGGGSFFDHFANGAKRAATAMARVIGSMKLFNHSAKATQKSTNTLSRAFLKLRTILSAMVLRKAINAMIKAIQEGIQSLAKYSGEVNTAMSALKTETTYFKNNIAAMFAPLVTAVVPMLTTFIGWINEAISALSQLLAVLSGKSTYSKAIKKQQDYAGSLNDTASAANNASKALHQLAIDEINTLDSSSSGGGGGSGIDTMFEEVEVDNVFEDIAKIIKRIIAPALKAWAKYGDEFKKAWVSAFSEVQSAVLEVGETWLAVWENGSGQLLVENILLLLISCADWIHDIAAAWRGAWASNGQAYVQSIFDLLNRILSLIHTISESFRTAWNAGSGEEILAGLLGTLTNIHLAVTNLATGFQKAWETAGIGDAIATGILEIFSTISGYAEKITGAIAEWASNVNFVPFLTAVRDILKPIHDLVTSMGDYLYMMWKLVWEPALTMLITGFLPELLKIIGGIFETISGLMDVIIGIVTFDPEMILQGARKLGTGLKDILITDISNTGERVAAETADLIARKTEDTTDHVGKMSGDTVDKIDTDLAAMSKSMRKTATDASRDFDEAYTEIRETGRDTFMEVSEVSADEWRASVETADDSTKEIVVGFEGLDESGTEAWESIALSANDTWEEIVATYSSAADWFEDNVFSGISGSLDALFTDLSLRLADLETAYKTMANTIIDYTNGMLSGFTAAINHVISSLNSLSVAFPDWVPDVGGRRFDVNIPNVSYQSIPKLAHGAVIPANREFLAVLGDQKHGRNLEAPEDLIRQIVRDEAGSSPEVIRQAIVAALQALGITADMFNVSLQVDSREIARAGRKGESKLGGSYGGPAFANVR